MHVSHASHALLKIQYVHASNLGIYKSGVLFNMKKKIKHYPMTDRLIVRRGYMCFLGFIRYNKTFIACGYRKYENLFTHEYHIPLGHDTLG